MKVFDLLKASLFIMALVLTVFFAGLISERYKVVHIQKELLQYDRALKIEEVKIKKKQLEIKNRELELQNVRLEAWLKAYDNGEYLVEEVEECLRYIRTDIKILWERVKNNFKDLENIDKSAELLMVVVNAKQLAEEAVQVAAVAEKFIQTIVLKGVED